VWQRLSSRTANCAGAADCARGRSCNFTHGANGFVCENGPALTVHHRLDRVFDIKNQKVGFFRLKEE